MLPSQKIIVVLGHEPLMYRKAVIPGTARLHQTSLTWSPGPLGCLGTGDSDLQRQSRAHSNTNTHRFPKQNANEFSGEQKRDCGFFLLVT